MNTIFDDMLATWSAFSQYQTKAPTKSLANEGFKDIIKRPHNIYTIKDDQDKVISYRLEVTTTPFKKDDVKVECSNDVLTVICGKENYKSEDDKFMTYRGISQQSYRFSVKLCNIDIANIKAKIEDGILRIDMPVAPEAIPHQITID